MNRKRLNRDKWGFQYYPYYQMRMDDELFHGNAGSRMKLMKPWRCRPHGSRSLNDEQKRRVDAVLERLGAI